MVVLKWHPPAFVLDTGSLTEEARVAGHPRGPPFQDSVFLTPGPQQLFTHRLWAGLSACKEMTLEESSLSPCVLVLKP